MSPQPELQLVQEGTMDRTPQPIVADFVEALGHHMRQKAADALEGGQGHGLPALVLGILIAKAHLTILNGEQAVISQRDPVDIAAQVVQDLLGALDGGFTVDDPSLGRGRLGKSQIGPFLMHEHLKQPAKELREGVDGYQVGRAGWPPLSPISGDPTGRYEAVHVRMVSQRAGPGVEHTQDSDQAAHIVRVRGELHERWGRGAEQNVVEVLLMTTDDLTELMGHGEDHVKIWDRQKFLPPCCQPGFGVQVMTLGATTVAAGVVDIVFLTTVLAWQQLPA